MITWYAILKRRQGNPYVLFIFFVIDWYKGYRTRDSKKLQWIDFALQQGPVIKYK